LRKTHWLVQGHAACGITGSRRLVSRDPQLVTCERCVEIRAVPADQGALSLLTAVSDEPKMRMSS